jgi:predicted metal-dependent peptidase
MASGDLTTGGVNTDGTEASKASAKPIQLSPEQVFRLKREAADRLAVAVVELFDTHPLYYQMLTRMVRVEASERAKNIPTMAVGFLPGIPHVALFYHFIYVSMCSDQKLKVLLIHEMQHIGLQHLTAMQTKDKRFVANIAADIVVNANIPEYKQLDEVEQDGITHDRRFAKDHKDPKKAGQLMFPSLRGIDLRVESIDSIYNVLMQNPEETADLERMYKEGALGGDSHDPWANLSPEERSQVDDLMRRSVNGLGGRDPGNVPGELRRLIDDLRKVKTDWKTLLTMFSQSITRDDRDQSWRRFNRRLGAASPGKVKTYRARLLVSIDNSGSITKELYNMFMSHILFISKMCDEVKVIGVDTRVNCETEIKNGILPTTFDFKSGGGTDFQPAFDWAKGKDYDGIIYLTDGEGPVPNDTFKIPVLFALCPHGHDVPGFKNIRIE